MPANPQPVLSPPRFSPTHGERCPPRPGVSFHELLSLSLWEGPVRVQLSSLEKEKDPELRARGLMDLAGRLALRDKVEAAQALLDFLPKTFGSGTNPWVPSLRAEAQELRAALFSDTPVLAQGEIFLHRLQQSISDPVGLGAFVAGGLAARLARGLAAGFLLKAGPAWWARGIAAQGLSGTIGLLAEATLVQAGPAILPRVPGGEGKNFSSENSWGSILLCLGGMRLAGWGTASLAGKIGRRRSAWIYPAGAFAGILLGRVLAERLSGGEGVKNPLFGSLEIFLFSRIGARFAGSRLGTSWGDDIGGGTKGRTKNVPWQEDELVLLTQTAPGKIPLPKLPERPPGIQLAMSQAGGGGGVDRSFLTRRWTQRFRRELGPRLSLSSETLQTVVDHFSQTAFAFVTQLDPLHRGTGSLYDFLLQYALERSLLRQAPSDFNTLVRHAGQIRNFWELEEFIGGEGLPPFKTEGKTDPGWEGILSSFELSPDARMAAHAYFHSLPDDLKNSLTSRHYLLDSTSDGEEIARTWDQATLLKGMRFFLDRYSLNSPEGETLVRGLERAITGKAPRARLERIFKLAVLDQGLEKLRETTRWEAFDPGGLWDEGVLTPLTNRFRLAAPRLNASVYTGYLNDLSLAEKIARIYSLADLYTPEEVYKRHRNETVSRAWQLLEAREGDYRRSGKNPTGATFSAEDVLEMLFLHPTEFALEARQAIRGKKEVELQVLSALEMERLWTSFSHPRRLDPAPLSFYVEASRSPSGKPLIALRELNPRLTRHDKARQAVHLAGSVVHEYEHHRHHGELDYSRREHLLIGEMRARAEEIFYHLRQGNISEWERMTQLSPYGLGIYLRNWVEGDYFTGLSRLP